MRRWRALAAPVAALTLALACGSPADLDAGVGLDAGRDSGSGGTDAGPLADSGTDASVADGDAGEDAAVLVDAGSDEDSGPSQDAGLDAGSLADAGPPADAGTCNSRAVRNEGLARGDLEVGKLCDDLYVCVSDVAEARRLEAASSSIQCRPDATASFCPGRVCEWVGGGPSVIDDAELAEICALSLVTPTPDLVCVVYGP